MGFCLVQGGVFEFFGNSLAYKRFFYEMWIHIIYDSNTQIADDISFHFLLSEIYKL